MIIMNLLDCRLIYFFNNNKYYFQKSMKLFMDVLFNKIQQIHNKKNMHLFTLRIDDLLSYVKKYLKLSKLNHHN